jgi:hypothetical protein
VIYRVLTAGSALYGKPGIVSLNHPVGKVRSRRPETQLGLELRFEEGGENRERTLSVGGERDQ